MEPATGVQDSRPVSPVATVTIVEHSSDVTALVARPRL